MNVFETWKTSLRCHGLHICGIQFKAFSYVCRAVRPPLWPNFRAFYPLCRYTHPVVVLLSSPHSRHGVSCLFSVSSVRRYAVFSWLGFDGMSLWSLCAVFQCLAFLFSVVAFNYISVLDLWLFLLWAIMIWLLWIFRYKNVCGLVFLSWEGLEGGCWITLILKKLPYFFGL